MSSLQDEYALKIFSELNANGELNFLNDIFSKEKPLPARMESGQNSISPGSNGPGTPGNDDVLNRTDPHLDISPAKGEDFLAEFLAGPCPRSYDHAAGLCLSDEMIDSDVSNWLPKLGESEITSDDMDFLDSLIRELGEHLGKSESENPTIGEHDGSRVAPRASFYPRNILRRDQTTQTDIKRD